MSSLTLRYGQSSYTPLVAGCFQQGMTSKENYARANGAAFDVLQSDGQVGRALFGEVAMTCLITMVLLLGAVNSRTRNPMVPFMVGCTVIFTILAGQVQKCSGWKGYS